jgi:hypothetical protein
VLVEHAWQVIDDMFVVMADLLKPDLSPEQTAALREHVQHCYMRRFLLDADSERHARVALLGLIDAAVTVTMTSGKPDVPPSTDWASATIERWVDWTLVRYAEDFPRFAEKLATAQKRGALRAVLSAWWLAKTGGNPPASTWKLLAELGKGVFATSNPEDWEKNVWSRKMRALVAIDDDE